MDADHPKVPPIPVGVNERNLADKCIAGDVQAGVRLVELLWQKGLIVSIDSLVRVAAPTSRLTSDGFDALCDAFQLASLIRYRRMHKIPDPDEQRPESD